MRRLVGLVLAVSCVVATGCSNLVSVEPVGGVIELDSQMETSMLLSSDGVTLAELHAEQDRDPVALDVIPAGVADAVVAVEDARFRQHGGLDGRAVARALVTNLVEGEVRQGGSTITQQLAKNAVVGTEQTLDRKLTEASVALQLEAQMTKDEILEHYLNTVYFGNGAYGVGAAARRYFDLDVAQLDLHHAALLAGMLRAPARYDPHDHPARAANRRDLVLGLMADQGLITAAEAAEAVDRPLDVTPLPPAIDWTHAYVVDHALHVLQHDPVFHVLGETPAERATALFGGGLTVETTVDVTTQRQAEAAVARTLVDPARDPRAALVAIDPATGEIRALVGGRDYTDPTDPVARFNLATDGRRQPGSAFKSMVLAAALEAGWSLEDTLPAPASIAVDLGDGRRWEVTNAAERGYDDLTLRTATALSVNTVFAQLVADVGVDAVIDVARRAGVTSPLEPLRSLALGSQEVSPLEMASVSATLAADGVHRDPTIIRRITDADGVVVWEHPRGAGDQALDPQVARMVTLALQDVVAVGTGVGGDLGRPTAGKTGTSQDNADAWFTGYTPDLAAAVWVGFPQARVSMRPPRTRVEVQGGGWPAEIFARFGSAALADTVATPFAEPGGDLVTVEVDLTRDCLPNPYTPRDVIGPRGYVAGTEPTEVCDQPSGPPTVDVPVVTGMDVDRAREVLHTAGFTVIEQPEHSTAVPPGRVLSQDPPPGADQQLTESGYVATLQVSSADRTGTVVPDVVNHTVDVARTTLEEEGFTVRVRLACPDGATSCAGPTARPGVVWQQTPDATTRVPVHSPVTLHAYPA